LTTDPLPSAAESAQDIRKSRRYRSASLGVLILGIFLSWTVWHFTSLAVHRAEKTRFDHRTEIIRELLDDRIGEYISALRGMRAFIDASERVTWKEWQSYIDELDMERHFDSVLGFSYIRYVPREGLARFLAEARSDGAPDFQLNSYNNHPDLFVVEFMQPIERNLSVIGYDLGQEPVRRRTLVEAVDKNRVTLSDLITLVRVGKEQPGFLLLLPVYHVDAPLDTREQRWKALRGWVGASISVEGLFSDIITSLVEPLDLEIFDTSKNGSNVLIYDADKTLWSVAAPPRHHTEAPEMHNQLVLEIADRTWDLNVFALPGFSKPIEHHMPEVLLVGGVILSLLSALLLTSYGRTTVRAQVLAERMLRDLRKSERQFQNLFLSHKAVMLLVAPEDGRIIDANEAASRFYGYPPERLKEMAVDELNLLPPQAVSEARQQIIHGEGSVFEFRHRLASGETRDVEVHSSPIEFAGRVALFSIIHDITPRKQAEKSLRESEIRFRLLFECNPDPVFLFRQDDGAIVDINLAFETTTGISRPEALGHNAEELGLWVDTAQRDHFWQMLGSEGSVTNSEAEFKATDGTVRTGLFSARRISIDQETCVLASLCDITSEKAAERSLIEMDRIKNEFISTAAHELRTPLCSIMGFAELMKAPEASKNFTDEEKSEFLALIHERGLALSRIIDDLLDISRIESGQPITLVRQPTDLRDILTAIVERYRLHVSEHVFRLALPEDCPTSNLEIDRQRIEQVVENLLSNAVKFSPKASEIRIEGVATNEGWEVRIIDEGIGMNPEQVSHIFDKFYRVDSSDTAVGGLGLGMSIAKQIVDAHGGKIWIESSPGQGTRACFSLPGEAARDNVPSPA